jgi:hypothetical protein
MNTQKSEVEIQTARAIREMAMLLLLRTSLRQTVTSAHSRRQPRKNAGTNDRFARGSCVNKNWIKI